MNSDTELMWKFDMQKTMRGPRRLGQVDSAYMRFISVKKHQLGFWLCEGSTKRAVEKLMQ